MTGVQTCALPICEFSGGQVISRVINKRDKIYAEFGDSSIESLKTVIGHEGSKDTFLWHINKLETDNNLNDRTKKEYWQYYFTKIFPVSLKMFKAMASYQVSSGKFKDEFNDGRWYLPSIYPDFMEEANRYDILISLVGFSPEPVMHTICTLQPKEKIYLICSNDTKDFPNTSVPFDKFVRKFVRENKLQLHKNEDPVELNDIGCENLGISVEAKAIDPTHSSAAIQVIKEIAEEEKIKNKKKVAIDITGGKKTMLAGAFTTASIFSIPGYYVDSQEYNNRSGRPVYGTEFLNKTRNPLTDFAIYKQNRKLYEKMLGLGRIAIDDPEMKQARKIETESMAKREKKILEAIAISDKTTGTEIP